MVLASRNEEALLETVRECRALGANAHGVPTDVADSEAVRDLATSAIERFAEFDLWINNAAVMVYGRWEDIPQDVYRQVMEVNLMGAIEGSLVAMTHFQERGRGHLINIGSLYAKMTSPLVWPYVASKFGLLGFTEVLRQEVGRDPDVHVSLVLPGSINTPIFQHAANYAGYSPRPVPPVSDVERAARRIERLIHRPRAVVTIGQVHRAFSWAHHFFPSMYARLAGPVMGAAGMDPFEVEPHEGNVFDSTYEQHGIRGDWPRRRDLQAIARALRAVIPGLASLVESTRARQAKDGLSLEMNDSSPRPTVGEDMSRKDSAESD